MKVILQQLFTPEQTINSERGSALCDDGSSQKKKQRGKFVIWSELA